ncbi:MAG: TonB family protein [Chitinispirillaceae bacterium]|nr:TonB family protein [Chitinispirillaceae bacterium]
MDCNKNLFWLVVGAFLLTSSFSYSLEENVESDGDSYDSIRDSYVNENVEIELDTLNDTLSQPDIMPELISFVKAKYPPELIKKGVCGTVLLELLVNEIGKVESAKVVSGINNKLDSCALEAALNFVFTPAKAKGVPVPVLIQYAYQFTLEEAIDSLVPYVNFSGVCLEKGTRKPIPDATISICFIDTSDTTLPVPFNVYLSKIGKIGAQQLDSNCLITTTDDSGHFSFYSLPSGRIRVKVIVPGFESFITNEKIIKSKETQIKYYIERSSYSDYEFVVYGKAPEKEVSRRTLTLNEIKKLPGFSGDAIKVIQALPGVARAPFGLGELVIRGAPTWDSRFFVEGMEIPMLYHFGLKSTYNSEALSSIDFYPGGFGTYYGGAVAGIVEICGRSGNREKIKGSAELSTLDGSLTIDGPIRDSITFISSFRRSFLGDVIYLLLEIMPDEMVPFSFYPYYWDYLLRVDNGTKKWGHFYLTLFGSQDEMKIIVPEMRSGSDEILQEAEKITYNTNFHIGILGWNYKISPILENVFRYNLSKINTSFNYKISKSNERVWINHLRDQLSWDISSKTKLNFGIDIQLIKYNVLWKGLNNESDSVESSVIDILFRDTTENFFLGNIGAYVNLEWKPHTRLLIIPGLRYDYYPELKYKGSILPAFWNYRIINNNRGLSGEPSARLLTRYKVAEHHTLKLSLGNYSQSPEPRGVVINPQWGDTTMPATKAAHYIAGYEWEITDLINLDLQLYFNKQWDIPLLKDNVDFIEDKNPSLYKKGGIGRMYGIEILLRHYQGKRFFGWLSYTLARSERFDSREKRWEIFDSDETHHLQLLGNWKLKKNWETGFRLRYVTGKPKTPIIGVIENENSSSISPIYGEEKSGRMAPFFQLDIRVDKKFVYKKWILSLFWDLQNISWFWYKSPELEIYNYDYTDKIDFSMIPTFAVGLRADF